MQHVVGAVVAGSWFTCSTLRRVEPYATKDRCTISGYTPTLQYPQTGRTLCNFGEARANECPFILAVPSDGSNPMQPPVDPVCALPDALAVPSDGSNPMQLDLTGNIASAVIELAVPSDGSNPMQL